MSVHPRGTIRAMPPDGSFFLCGRLTHDDDSAAPRCTGFEYQDRTGRMASVLDARPHTRHEEVILAQFVKPDRMICRLVYEARGSHAGAAPRSRRRSGRNFNVRAYGCFTCSQAVQGDTPPTFVRRYKWLRHGHDDRGNGAAPNMLMTTKCPSSAVLMELASRLKMMRMKAAVHQTAGGKQRSQCIVDRVRLQWWSLPEALEKGQQAEVDFKTFKDGGMDP